MLADETGGLLEELVKVIILQVGPITGGFKYTLTREGVDVVIQDSGVQTDPEFKIVQDYLDIKVLIGMQHQECQVRKVQITIEIMTDTDHIVQEQ